VVHGDSQCATAHTDDARAETGDTATMMIRVVFAYRHFGAAQLALLLDSVWRLRTRIGSPVIKRNDRQATLSLEWSE
jgi:hypothetical protein